MPSVFRAAIHNLGPSTETVDISFANVPAGFEALSAVDQLGIPAGQTGIIGFHLNPTAPLPPPGSNLAFDVTVHNSNSSLSQTQTVAFTMPEVHGVRLLSDPPGLTTTPGTPIQTVLVIEARGNVPETVNFTVDAPALLAVEGLQQVVLNPGEIKVLFLMLRPQAGTPLNTTLSAAITASFGGREPVTLLIPVHVAAPGVESISRAATSARQFGNESLANRLDDLGIALTNLTLNPASEVFKSQALADLTSILSLLAVDPILSRFVDDLTAPRDLLAVATTPDQVLVALNSLGTALDGFGDAVFFQNEFNFELFLTPNTQVAQPQVPVQYQLLVHHTGYSQATYNVSLAGLPQSVTRQLSQTQVTLNPGQSTIVLVTLTQTSDAELLALSFTVDVAVDGFPYITRSAVGAMTARNELVSVVSVTADPPFADPGDPVNISTRLLNAVNRQQQALVFYTLFDPAGIPILTSSPVPVQLSVQTSLADVDLGPLDTTGFALGQYTIEVTVTDTLGVPFPGATGRGTLLIGSPVTATLAVVPQALPPGTSTVTNTLEIESQTAFNDPFNLLGQASASGASDAIRNGDFVYVATPSGIRLYNVAGANVMNPQLVRTFGTNTFKLQIRGNLLVAVRGGVESSRLDTYSLTDPSNPQFLGTTGEIPYGSAASFVLTDTHAIIVMVNLFFFSPSNDVNAQAGAVFAVNLTNPAAPFFDGDAVSAEGTPAGRDGVNDGVLFNANGTSHDNIGSDVGPFDQSGGNQMTWDIKQVSPAIVLVTGSSASGGNTQAGVGLVRVVDISDPRNMVLLRDLQIPGTVHAFGIAIEGNLALVTATEGGIADFTAGHPFTGRIVLATLDLTDPANPQLLHTQFMNDLARSITFDAALGNGLFAVGTGGTDGSTPRLYLVDANDPDNLVFSSIAAPAIPSAQEGGGNLALTTDGSSLIIYDTTGVGFIPVTASVQIPKETGVTIVPGSFNIPPTQIVPGVDFDTLIFDIALSAGQTTQTITWQATVGSLQPGESREVTLDTTIDFFSQGSPGQITLPPEHVFAEQVLSIDPPSRMVQPGEVALYTVTIANPASMSVTYDLSVQGVPAEWVDLISQVTVPAGGSIDLPLTLTSSPFDPLATYAFIVTASVGGTHGSVEATLILSGPPLLPLADPIAHGVVTTITPTQATAGQGTSSVYIVRVTNTGSVSDTFDLSISGLPVGVIAAFAETSIDVPPGAGSFRDITLVLTVPQGTAPAGYPFTVIAASSTLPDIADTAAGVLTVVVQGVSVTLSPPTGPPGTTFQMTVTNTGSVTDVFDLTLAGPAALAASLATSQVSLFPGASRVVQVTTSSIDFVYPGDLLLAAVARSRGNTSVVDSATANLVVPHSIGLEAVYEPNLRVLPQPGGTTFLLLIDNLGNGEDAYEVSIVHTAGLLSAALMGLDGEKTQSIPVVRLPGLNTAALVVDAEIANAGVGTVTVLVRSLNHAALSDTVTATLKTIDTDFGDAPDSYHTRLASNGARHNVTVAGPILGTLRDTEFDAPALLNGAGDDLNGDDEDGVVFSNATLVSGQPGTVTVTVSSSLGNARVYGWIDFNGDGDFSDPGEQIAAGAGALANLGNGARQITFTTPNTGFLGSTFARFRVSTQAGLSFDGLAFDGEVEDHAVTIVAPPAPPPPITSLLVTGADAGGGPHVKVYDASTSQLLFSFFAYDAHFTGGVRVAAGDVNGDGTPDIITGAGPSGGPHVRVFDGRTGQQLPGAIGSFFAYDSKFTGGVFVATGDVNGDGFADIVTGADAGGGPHVRVFDGRTGAQLPGHIGSFFAYKPDLNAGVRVAAGDVDGDGRADVITGMGAGYATEAERGVHFGLMAQQEVRVFSGVDGMLLKSLVPFEPGYRGGVHLAVGHIHSNSNAEILVSKANGDQRTDALFDGLYVNAFRRSEVSVFDLTSAGTANRLADFTAYQGYGGSVRLAVIDQLFRDLPAGPDYDGPAILCGAGPGGGPHVKLRDKSLSVLDNFFAYNADFLGGLWVAGS